MLLKNVPVNVFLQTTRVALNAICISTYFTTNYDFKTKVFILIDAIPYADCFCAEKTTLLKERHVF